MNFKEFLALIRQNKGIVHLADIARELNVSPQTVSNWKARDQVPYKYVVMVNEVFGGGDIEGMETEESAGAPKTRGEEVQPPMPYGSYVFPEEDEISLTEIIAVLKKHIRMILAVPTVTCMLTIIYVLFIAEPVFTSTSTILPSAGGGSTVSNLRAMASQFGINIPSDDQASPTYVYPEIIQSRTLARKLLNQKFDTEKFGSAQSLLKIITYGDDEPEFGPDTLEKMAIEIMLEGMIEVSTDRQSSIITLSINAMEPELAAEINESLIKELDKHQQEFKTSRVGEKRQFIEDRMKEVNNDLESAEDDLKIFRERNRQIVSPALLLEQERYQREVEVQKGIFITLKQEYELAKIQEVEEATVVHVLDPPEAPIHKSSPKRKQSVILAGFLGIGIGVVAAFIRNWYEISQSEGE